MENAINYVKGNFWPSIRFSGQQDLNRQAKAWCDGVADSRIHGTTGQARARLLERERPELLAPYLRRDRFVYFEGSRYGVPWRFAEKIVSGPVFN